jgi:hypothetical protein
MSSIILLVFEGEKTEPHISENLTSVFFRSQKNIFIQATFKAEIYQLWKQINSDEFLDLFELLKERENPDLVNISRDDVSEIHLFFDHDGHSHPEIPLDKYNAIIREMLSTFNNETDKGKLYISYPMVEAVKDCTRDLNKCFRCNMFIKENIAYKMTVNNRSCFIDLREITYNDWLYIISINVDKATCLCTGEYQDIGYDQYRENDQLSIFANQETKFINKSNSVIVLSGVPFFLIDFFGESLYRKVKDQKTIKPCNFFCTT